MSELISSLEDDSIVNPLVAKTRLKDACNTVDASLKQLLQNDKIELRRASCFLKEDISLEEITSAMGLLVKFKASLNKFCALMMGDIWNATPSIYGDKSKVFREAGIPEECLQQIRNHARVARVWPDERDRLKAGYTFLRETAKHCFSDAERRRYLEDYRAKTITLTEIAAEAKRRNATGLYIPDYTWIDNEEEPQENKANPPILLASEEMVLLQAVRLLRGTPQFRDMLKIVSERRCCEQNVAFNSFDFDWALARCKPYPQCEQAVAQ